MFLLQKVSIKNFHSFDGGENEIVFSSKCYKEGGDLEFQFKQKLQ